MKTFKQYENKVEEIDSICENMKYDDLVVEEAEHQGKKVKLNNPTRSNDGKKKFYVYVKNEKGNIVKVGFGDPNMEIKRDDPNRRKNFSLVIFLWADFSFSTLYDKATFMSSPE